MDINKPNTTNYSQRNIGNKFKKIDNDMNKYFEVLEERNYQESILQKNLSFKEDDISFSLKPHQRTIEDIIMGMRELFFKILEMLIDKDNPIPYIFSSEYRQFDFTLFLIIIGSLLLLLSNIMK